MGGVGSLCLTVPLLARPASVEQHSLHLPVFVDTMISNAVTAGVHEAIPDDCLVLPCQYL